MQRYTKLSETFGDFHSIWTYKHEKHRGKYTLIHVQAHLCNCTCSRLLNYNIEESTWTF